VEEGKSTDKWDSNENQPSTADHGTTITINLLSSTTAAIHCGFEIESLSPVQAFDEVLTHSY
jgi:hypothetical protein